MEHWWVYRLYQDGAYIELVSWTFWVLLSITLHELGHGWAAMRLGDRTPELTGHMTMNPFVHMGPMSIIVFALTSMAWGAMPVDPSRLRGRHGEAIMAGAGPAVNLLMAIVIFGGLVVALKFMPEGKPLGNLTLFLFTGAWLNIALVCLNLLPIPPLDGSRILAVYNRSAQKMFDHPHAAMVGTMIFCVLIFGSPIGEIAISVIQAKVATGVVAVGHAWGSHDLREVLSDLYWGG